MAPEWIYYQQAKFLGFSPPRPYFHTIEQYQRMSIINQYADVILASMIAPRGLFIPGIADVDEWSLAQKQSYLAQQPMKKDPNKVYIVHAAGAAWKKGSAIISALLEDCRAKGLPIENIFLQTKPEKARPFFALADFVVEQVGVGTFGLLGVEMMTWEIPILCYHTDLWDRIRDYPPRAENHQRGVWGSDRPLRGNEKERRTG